MHAENLSASVSCMATINRPVPFPGTPEEAAANLRTHAFYGPRCDWCDCRPSHEAARYPCGTKVPREVVEIPT